MEDNTVKIVANNEVVELHMFGKFEASWDLDTGVDVTKTILPYAVKRAVEIGKERKAVEIRKVLGC